MKAMQFLCLLLAATFLSANRVFGQVLFYDDFTGSKLNTTNWSIPTGPGSFYGRTQIRATLPKVSNGSLLLALDTFNPTALVPGDSFLGSEVVSKRTFNVPTKGISFETRMRMQSGEPAGLVGAFFTYSVNGSVRDEIDFELLSNDLINPSHRVLTNSFKAMNFSLPGAKSFVTLGSQKMTKFNKYEIRWFPTRVEWYVNGILRRTETNVVPNRGMNVHLNHWAPDQYFSEAFSPSIVPVKKASENKSYQLEIDYVIVRALR